MTPMRSIVFLIACCLMLSNPTCRLLQAETSSRSRASHPVAALVYHHFLSDEEARRHPSRLDDLTVSASQLREQLEYLNKKQATALTTDELLKHVFGEKEAPPRSFVIVIDDGYDSVYRVAWPILKELGIPAALAVMVRASEDPAAWSRRYPGGIPHMSWPQILEMQKPVKCGTRERVLVSIESHTYDRHVNLREEERKKIPLGEKDAFHRSLEADLRKAREIIQLRTGGLSRGDLLVWPHGATSSSLVQVARRAGYKGTFAGLGATIRTGTDPLRMPRIHAGSGVRGLKSFTRDLEEAGWDRP